MADAVTAMQRVPTQAQPSAFDTAVQFRCHWGLVDLKVVLERLPGRLTPQLARTTFDTARSSECAARPALWPAALHRGLVCVTCCCCALRRLLLCLCCMQEVAGGCRLRHTFCQYLERALCCIRTALLPTSSEELLLLADSRAG